MTNINCTADCIYQNYGKCMLSHISDSVNLDKNNDMRNSPEISRTNIVDCAYYRKKR